MLSSKWVRVLKSEQHKDGSWGRFHTQDTKLKAKFPTTEFAIDRAIALGLPSSSEILSSTREYLHKVLKNELRIRDQVEKSSLWDTGIKLILTSYLAKIDSDCEFVHDEWVKWSKLASETLITREYDPDYARKQYTWSPDRRVEQEAVLLKTKYALGLLGTHSHKLPPELDDALVEWTLKLPRGIAYLETPLETREFTPGSLDRWLTSIEILSRFKSSAKHLHGALELISNWQNKAGLWDFGPFKTKSPNYPLSENWQRKGKREEDYSVRILSLLRKF